jgi:hypothetical protein
MAIAGLAVSMLIQPGSAIAYDPLDCLNDAAKVDKDIIVGLSTKLCSGAWTAEPVKCYAQVSRV